MHASHSTGTFLCDTLSCSSLRYWIGGGEGEIQRQRKGRNSLFLDLSPSFLLPLFNSQVRDCSQAKLIQHHKQDFLSCPLAGLYSRIGVIINGKGHDMVFEIVVLLITSNNIVQDYIVMKCQDGTVWQYLQRRDYS